MPERPRHAAFGRRHIRMRRPLVIAGVLVVAGGAAAGAVAASNHGGGNGGPASGSPSACSAPMAFWQPRAAAALRGISTDAGRAQDAASVSGPTGAPQDGIFLTMLGSIAAQALRYDLPPPCAPQLRASFRVSMSDFVQASRDASRHDPRGAMTKLSAGTKAERPVIAALSPAGQPGL
jgi:hypothetical protein